MIFLTRQLISMLTLIGLSCLYVNSQLIINEIMASNANTYLDTRFYNYPDWIELKNTNTSSTSTSGLYISDDRNYLKKWKIPVTTIPSNGCYLLFCDSRSYSNHTNFKLSNNGETIYLVNIQGEILDSIKFPNQYPDVSYGLSIDLSTWHYCTEPTPGAQNTVVNATSINPQPAFSIAPGRYSQVDGLEILSSNTFGSVYYSTNGSTPFSSDQKVTGSFNFTSTTVIKARVFSDNLLPSLPAAATYFINEHPFTLPVVSISTNPVYLWDDMQGIYVRGTNGIQEKCSPWPTNWNQNWERAAYFEYFDQSGNRVAAQPVGIKIAGGCTRMADQKSLSIYARGKYGKGSFDYPFFKDKPLQDNYQSILIRNSGNDFNRSMFRDIFMVGLTHGATDIDHQAYQPVIAYLNGDFIGLMNLREKTDEDYFFTNYGYTDDLIDFLEGSGSVIRGSNSSYNSMISFVQNNDMEDDNNYSKVISKIDKEEYINYLAFQTYLANTDWPGNNIKYWRPKNGKWRWILYDTDFGFGLTESPTHNTLHFITEANGPSWPNPPWSTLLMRKLLENDSFKKEFVQTLLTHTYSTFHPDRCNELIDSLSSIIEFEMNYFKPEYGGNMNDWYNEIQNMKNWGLTRFNYMPGYIEDFFHLNSLPQTISVNHSLEGKGKVDVNGITLTHYPFSMITYEELPYSIASVPEDGYKFSHWVTSSSYTIYNLISEGAAWKYLDEATDYPVDWTYLSFDDAAWAEGPAQLGYGDGDETTILSYGGDAGNKNPTALFRKEFEVSDTSGIIDASARILFDDGCIVYLNETEIHRINMATGTINFSDYAISGPPTENTFENFEFDKNLLNQGTNILSVEMHQIGPTSSDISFDFAMDITKKDEVEEVYFSDNSILSGDMSETIGIRPVFSLADSIMDIQINEIANASSFLVDDLGRRSDFVELYNTSDDSIDVGGLFLTDDYLFPLKSRITTDNPELTTIPPKEFLVLYADGTSKSTTTHLNFRLDKDGEQIALVQKIGESLHFIDSLSFNFLERNYSYGRYKDGTDDFYYMSTLTPGDTNTLAVYITSYPEMISNTEIIMYPNPAEDYLNIKIENPNEFQPNYQLMIFDISGRVVQLKNNIENELTHIDISHLKQGMYIIQVMRNNKRMCIEKIVKQ